ncbi:MAG: T9SS type A sorting domain-containing protein [Bacteroidetes bacterium]|nr:T9SS type A sorting domain-containing protein [Bacteroidota bacterium]
MTAPQLHNAGFFRPWNDKFYLGDITPYRYFQDGTQDTTFNILKNGTYHPLQGGDYFVLPDGGLLISGVLPVYETIGQGNTYCLLRFTNDGSLDTTFQPRTCSGDLNYFTQLPNGQFIGTGSISTWDGQPASNIIRFNADGSLDPTFQAHIWWGQAWGFLPMADGRVYVGGQFRIEGRQDTMSLVRFMPDGSLDPTFNNTLKFLGLNMSAMQHDLGIVRKVYPLADGSIIASGNFDHVGEQQRGCIAHLDSSGTLLDDCFTGAGAGIFTSNTGTTSASLGMTQAPDGNYYIWGVYVGYDDGITNDPTQRFVSRLYGLNVGIEEQSASPIQPLEIAPNPGNGGAVQLTVGTAPKHAMLSIHDASGRVVRQEPWPAGVYTHTLRAGLLAPGTYMLRVASSASTLYSGKLIVLP